GIAALPIFVVSRALPQPPTVAGLDLGQFGVALTIFAAWTSFWTIIDPMGAFDNVFSGLGSREPDTGAGLILGLIAALLLAAAAVATPLVPAPQGALVPAARPAAPQPYGAQPPGGYGYPGAPQQASFGGQPQPGQPGQQPFPGQPQGQPAAPAAGDFSPFWFAVPVARPLFAEDGSPSPIAELAPGTWYLAAEQRGQALVAQTQDGRRGVLPDTSGIQRGCRPRPLRVTAPRPSGRGAVAVQSTPRSSPARPGTARHRPTPAPGTGLTQPQEAGVRPGRGSRPAPRARRPAPAVRSAHAEHAVRAAFRVRHHVGDERVRPRLGEGQLDEPSGSRRQVEHLRAAAFGASGAQGVGALPEDGVELPAHDVEGAGPVGPRAQHPHPDAFTGAGGQRVVVVLVRVAVEGDHVGPPGADLVRVGRGVLRAEVELGLHEDVLAVGVRQAGRVDDHRAEHAVGDVQRHRHGGAVVHPDAAAGRREAVGERPARLEGAHRPVRGQRAGVEVDGVADGAVVDQGD